MHEMSIATALLDQVESHLPTGAVLRHVYVKAGAMEAIEPDAMNWAWRALTDPTRHDGAELHLTIEPYRLECPSCGRQWNSGDLYVACECGYPRPRSIGESGLTLLSMTVDEPDNQECLS
jgi:Zn finger protein HypA/HybF involved in hydrogenase expression